MIVFFSTFDVMALVLLFFFLLVGAVEAVMSLIWIIIVLSCIIIVVKDVFIGFFKKKNDLLLTFIYLLIDGVRNFLFFDMMISCINDYENSGGLSMFGELSLFVFALIVGGAIYSVGELLSVGHASENELNKKQIIAIDLLWVIILGVFYCFMLL